MDREVISDLYNRAKAQGYTKSEADFIKLIHTDVEVQDDMYNYVLEQGYQKDINSFKSLIGAGDKAPVSPLLSEDGRDIALEQKLPTLKTQVAQREQERRYDKKKDLGEFSTTLREERKPLSEKDFKPIDPEKVQKGEKEFNRRLDLLKDSRLYSQTEEALVPQLSNALKEYGFTFEEAGVGDFVDVVAPNGQKHRINSPFNVNKYYGDKREGSKEMNERDLFIDFVQANKPGANILADAVPDKPSGAKLITDWEKKYAETITLPKIKSEIESLSEVAEKLFLTHQEEVNNIFSEVNEITEKYKNGEISYKEYVSSIEAIKQRGEEKGREVTKKSSDLINKVAGLEGDMSAMMKAVDNYSKMQKSQRSVSQVMRDKFESGLMTTSASLWRTPEYIYDYLAWFMNYVSDLTGAGKIVPTSKQLGETLGISNTTAQMLEERAKELTSIETEYDGSIIDYINKGEYGLASKATAAAISESLPFTLGIMAGSGLGVSTSKMFGFTTLAMAAQRKQELDEDLSLSEQQRITNSMIYGFAEAFEVLLGAGSFGRNLRKIATQGGMSKAKQFGAKTLATLIDENPWLSPFKEGLQEVLTTMLQNVADITVLGEDKNVGEGVGDAFVVGTVMGSGFATVQVAAQGVSDITKSVKNKRFYDAISDISTNQVSFEKVVKELDNRLNNLEITEAEYAQEYNNLANSVGVFRSIPETLDEKQRRKAFPLLVEKKYLEELVKDVPVALVESELERIESIDEELRKITKEKKDETSKVTAADAEAVEGVGDGVVTEVSEGETGETGEAADKEAIDIYLERIELGEDLYGLYDEVESAAISAQDKEALLSIIEEEITKQEINEQQAKTKTETTPEGEAVTSVGVTIKQQGESRSPQKVDIGRFDGVSASIGTGRGVSQKGVLKKNDRGNIDFVSEDGRTIPIDVSLLGFVKTIKDSDDRVIGVEMYDTKTRNKLTVMDSEIGIDIGLLASYNNIGEVSDEDIESAIEEVTKQEAEERQERPAAKKVAEPAEAKPVEPKTKTDADKKSEAESVPMGDQPDAGKEVRGQDTKGKEAPRKGTKEEVKPTPKKEVSEQVEKIAKNVGVKAKNIRDLYDINRNIWGLNRVQALATSVVQDRMIGQMAKRAGISKQEMYGRLKFEKATEDFVKGLSEKGKALWQIIGQNANLSENVRQNLQVARDMELAGKDAKTIRIATGWEKGADGKWRYEINDFKLIDRFKNNDRVKSTLNKLSKGYSVKISDLGFESLLDIYPQLSDYTIELFPTGNTLAQFGGKNIRLSEERYKSVLKDIVGELNRSGEFGGSYILSNKYLSQKISEIESNIYHEIQHAIQEIEGFARGGNEEMFGDAIGSIKKEYQSLYQEYVFRKKAIENGEKSRDGNTIMYDGFVFVAEELENKAKELEQKINQLKDVEKAKWISPYEAYKRLSGEVEARNVQARMGMTEQQRRETLLSETEDVARDEQIILFGESGIPQGVKFQAAMHGSPYVFPKEILVEYENGKQEYLVGTEIEWPKVPSKAKVVKEFPNGRFRTDKIGTGEGAQAFGWGLYFTDLESIARSYADKLAQETSFYDSDGNKIDYNNLSYAEQFAIIAVTDPKKRYETTLGIAEEDYKDNPMEFNRDYLSAVKKFKGVKKLRGVIYKASLHKGKTPDQYTWLEWDKPVGKNILSKIDVSGLYTLEYDETDADETPYTIKYKKGGFDYARTEEEAMDIAKKVILDTESGKDLYNYLSENIGGDKQASLFLLENGIDGIKYPAESISRGATSDTARGFNYVVFDENAVSIEEVVKFQKNAIKARGAMMIQMDGQAVLFALTDPNVSTPLHELAHVFEHYLTEAEKQAVIKNAGTKGWTTETSEYFARGFEKYLAEGKAPTPLLQKIFEKFKQWLTDIYNGITNSEIDIELNTEMRAIYDSMLEAQPETKAAPTPLSNEENVIVEELSKELDVPKTEIAKTKNNNEQTTRKSKNIARTVKSEAKNVEDTRNVKRAAEIVETIEATTDAILNNQTESDAFETKYGVNPIDVAENFNEMNKNNADVLDAFASVKGIDRISKSEFEDQFGDYNEFLKEFLIAVSGMKLKHAVEIDFLVDVKVNPVPKKIKEKNTQNNLKPIVAKDPMRPNMEGIYFEEGNAIATDAHKLVVIKNNTSEAEIIKDAIDAHYKEFKKTIPTYTRKQAEEYVKSRLKDGKLDGAIINPKTGDVVDAIYPKYKYVIPSHKSKIEGIDANKLFAEVNGAELASKNAQFGFYVIPTENGDISVNPKLLREVVEALIANGAKTLTLEYEDANKGIVLRADNGDYGLVMPFLKGKDSKGIVVTSEVLGGKPSVEAAPETSDALKDVESTAKALEGKEMTYEAYRGQDAEYKPVEYDGTYGKGTYYTGDKKSAYIYGDKVKKYSIKLYNPFIIRGQRLPNVPLESMAEYINENVKGKGYDGVVLLDKDGNVFELVKFEENNASISEAYHKAKADDSNPALVEAVEKLLAPEASEVQKAREEFERAKRQFTKDMGNLQSGGYAALGSFVNYVRAFVKLKSAEFAEFIKQYRQDNPTDISSDELIENMFNNAIKTIQANEKIQKALDDKKQIIAKLRTRLRQVSESKEKAKESLKELKEIKNALADYIVDNFPKGDLISASIARDIAKSNTKKQVEKVMERLDKLKERIKAREFKNEQERILEEERAIQALIDEQERARKAIIKQIQDLINPANWKKAKGQSKLAKTKIDEQAKEDIKLILSMVDVPLNTLSSADLLVLKEALDEAYQQGRFRVKQVEKLNALRRKKQHLAVMDMLYRKKNRYKPLTDIAQAVQKLKEGNVVVYGGKVYNKSMVEEFMMDVGMSVPDILFNGVLYNVRQKKSGEYSILKRDANGKLVSAMIPKDSSVRAEIERIYKEKLDKAMEGEIDAKYAPAPPPYVKNNFLYGYYSWLQTLTGYLYDFMATAKDKAFVTKVIEDPSIKAQMKSTEDFMAMQMKHKDNRKKIFGSDRKAKSKLGRSAGIKVIDKNGEEISITNGQAIYLFNVTQRAEMVKKFLDSGFTQEQLTNIYNYIMADPELKAYAKSMTDLYASYLPEINKALAAENYGSIEPKVIPSLDKLKAQIGDENAELYYQRMTEIYNGVMPMYEPYSPASVLPEDAANDKDVNMLFEEDKNKVLSVISNNAIETVRGGKLQFQNSEQMFNNWAEGMTNMVNKLSLASDYKGIFNSFAIRNIQNLYGKAYARNFQETLNDVLLGKSQKNLNQNFFSKYLNQQSAVTMFLNFPSAIGQSISSFNYMFDAADEGVLSAYLKNLGKGFFDKDARKTFAKLSTAMWIKARMKGNLSSQELREIANNSSKAEEMISNTLSLGYTPTRTVDAAAITLGGTPFFMAIRDRQYEFYKKTMPADKAMEMAEGDALYMVYKKSNFSQQSSEQFALSKEQKNIIVRQLLTYGSVNLQYNRIIVRAIRDIRNNRGDLRVHLANIVFYGFLQNLVFQIYSKALSGILSLIGDDDDEEIKRAYESSFAKVANATFDTLMRGFGALGAVMVTLKNTIYDMTAYTAMQNIRRDTKEERERVRDLNRQLKALGYDFKYTEDDINSMSKELIDYLVETGESRERLEKLSPANIVLESVRTLTPNPGAKIKSFIATGQELGQGNYLKGGAKGIEALTNIPTGRLYTIGEQIDQAFDESLGMYERGLSLLGIFRKYDFDNRKKREIQREKESEKIMKEAERERERNWKEYMRTLKKNNPALYKNMKELERKQNMYQQQSPRR